MKCLTWILALMVLLAFAMPVMGTESAPPGDVVMDQSIDTFDPVPAVQALEQFPGLYRDEIKTEANVSAYDSQHQSLMGIHGHAYCVSRASLLSLTRQISDTVQTATLRLWRPEGGDGIGQSLKTGSMPLIS